MKISIKGRLAFPQLWEPKAVNGEGEPAHSATVIMAKDSPEVSKVEAAIDAVGREKWKDKWPAVKKELTNKDKLCLHDGDDKASYDGFPGNLYVSARNKSRPLVIDRDKTPLTKADGRPYGGCFVVANIEIWAQDNTFGKRINASLRGVQFDKDGDSFGGGTPASTDEFEELGEEDSLV